MASASLSLNSEFCWLASARASCRVSRSDSASRLDCTKDVVSKKTPFSSIRESFVSIRCSSCRMTWTFAASTCLSDSSFPSISWRSWSAAPVVGSSRASATRFRCAAVSLLEFSGTTLPLGISARSRDFPSPMMEPEPALEPPLTLISNTESLRVIFLCGLGVSTHRPSNCCPQQPGRFPLSPLYTLGNSQYLPDSTINSFRPPVAT